MQPLTDCEILILESRFEWQVRVVCAARLIYWPYKEMAIVSTTVLQALRVELFAFFSIFWNCLLGFRLSITYLVSKLVTQDYHILISSHSPTHCHTPYHTHNNPY